MPASVFSLEESHNGSLSRQEAGTRPMMAPRGAGVVKAGFRSNESDTLLLNRPDPQTSGCS